MKKILMFTLCMILLIGSVSALEFDNVQSYDPITRVYTIENFFGLGETLAEIRLNSNINVILPRGYKKVAEFELYNFKKDYNEAFKDLNFYQANDLSKEISRTFDYRYLDYQIEEEAIYETICQEKMSTNGTLFDDCKKEEVSKQNILAPVWIKFSDINKLPSNQDSFTIGIFTEVLENDYVEWIPTFFGEKLTEWATWEESMEVGLVISYRLEEASGTVIDDIGNYDGVNNGADTQQIGKNNYGYNFTQSEYDFINVSNFQAIMNENAGTISWWFYPIGSCTNNFMFFHINDQETNERFSWYLNTGSGSDCNFGGGFFTLSPVMVYGDISISLNEWSHAVLSWDGTTLNITLDGALEYSSGYTPITSVDEDLRIASWFSTANPRYFDGTLDELLWWDRTLSPTEISTLYDSGTGTFYFSDPDEDPSITLNSPSSTNYTTAQTLDINFTVWDDINLTDVKLYVNDVLNQTNATGINNTNYIFSLGLGNGNFTIYGTATDNDSQSTNSSSINIFIDTIKPTFEIISPTTDIITTSLPKNATLNITTTDLNLNMCWYYTSDNATNITYTCNTTTNISFSTGGSKTIYVYANDTLGNENGTSTTFLLNYIQETATYDTTVIETENHTLILNITASDITSINGTLIYNGTEYAPTITSDSTTALFTTTLTAPLVSANTLNYFNWTYTLNGVDYNSSAYNHTVVLLTPLLINATCSDQALRFDIQDEDNLTALYGDIDYNFKFGLSNDTLKEVYGTLTNVTTFYVCINASVSQNYTIGYGEIQYKDTAYVDRRYYLFEEQIISNNTLTNHTLRDLLIADQTSFLLTMEDTSLNVYANMYTALWRWYPNLNEYQIVEMGKTDETGQTVAHIRTEDVDYRVGLYYTNGTLLKLGDPLRFLCTSAPCSFTLRVGAGDVDYSSFFDVQASIDYNQTSKMFTFIYNDPNQYTSGMRFLVTRETGTDTLIICNDTSSGFTGVMNCNTSAYTGMKKATAFRSASPPIIITQKIVKELNTAFNSSFALFIFVFIWLAILLSGFGNNPIWTIILAIVGLIPAMIFGSINVTIFTGIAILGAIVIHFIKRAVNK